MTGFEPATHDHLLTHRGRTLGRDTHSRGRTVAHD